MKSGFLLAPSTITENMVVLEGETLVFDTKEEAEAAK